MVNYSLVQGVYKSQQTELEVSQYNIFRDILYCHLIYLVISVPIVLLIEIPAANIEALLLSRNPNQNQSAAKNIIGEISKKA